jgi:hypothetical protein
MMEVNYLLEGHALTHTAGRYTVHYDRIRPVIAPLAKELLTIEATGDRTRAEALLAKYDTMPAELIAALKGTKDIPVGHVEDILFAPRSCVGPVPFP